MCCDIQCELRDIERCCVLLMHSMHIVFSQLSSAFLSHSKSVWKSVFWIPCVLLQLVEFNECITNTAKYIANFSKTGWKCTWFYFLWNLSLMKDKTLSEHFGILMELRKKKTTSTPLMMEKPVRNPMVPPMRLSWASTLIFLSLSMLSKVAVSK